MLPKTKRLLRKNVEFLLKKGQTVTTPSFTAKIKPSNINISRYCVIVSKKIYPKAVHRNRLRRQIYELIRFNEDKLARKSKNMDSIIIAKPSLKNKSFETVNKEILLLFQKIT